METLSDALRMIHNLIVQGNLANGLWEITELENYLSQNHPQFIEKYHLKSTFLKWRTRLMRTNPQGIRLILNEIELLARKFDNVILQ